MLKNKLPIFSLISIAVIFIGLFIFLFSISNYEVKGLNHEVLLMLIMGLSLFITGISIFIKKVWIRTILIYSLLSLIIFLVYLIIIEWNKNSSFFKIDIQLILFIGLQLLFIFILHKKNILIGVRNTDKELEDVLDHFE